MRRAAPSTLVRTAHLWKKGVSSKGFALLLVAMLIPVCRAGTIVTLTFKTEDTQYTVSFDSSKISDRKMRELIILSPLVTDYAGVPGPGAKQEFQAVGSTTGDVVDKSLAAVPLELCDPDDPRYVGCATNDISSPDFLRNAEVNLERSRRGLAWLQQIDHPQELQPVLAYLQERLALSLWIEERRFEYYSTWDDRALQRTYDGVDPAAACGQTFKELPVASSPKLKHEIVRVGWVNCIRQSVFARQPGRYPVRAWNAFLKAYGITENYKEIGPD
jgi:hypothetical protein